MRGDHDDAAAVSRSAEWMPLLLDLLKRQACVEFGTPSNSLLRGRDTIAHFEVETDALPASSVEHL